MVLKLLLKTKKRLTKKPKQLLNCLRIFIKRTLEIIAAKNYKIGNIDSTISLQKPKIKDFIPEMQLTLAKVCEIDVDQIAIKATTTEKLGFEGREEGVSASAVILIYKENAQY